MPFTATAARKLSLIPELKTQNWKSVTLECPKCGELIIIELPPPGPSVGAVSRAARQARTALKLHLEMSCSWVNPQTKGGPYARFKRHPGPR